MNMEEKIKAILESEINAHHIEIINESNLHAGHSGDDGSGQTHFKLMIVSDDFKGYNRIQRQRTINKFLGHLFEQGLHALSMELLTLEESNI